VNGDPAIGILLAVLVDIVLPLGLAVPLILQNRRRSMSRGGEKHFWIGAAIYLAVVSFAVWRGLVDVFAYQGAGVVGSTVVTLPTSLVPAVFNSMTIHHFFTFADWTHFGYVSVLTVYVTGMLGWGLFNAVAFRALILIGGRAYVRGEQAARSRQAEAHTPDGLEKLGLAADDPGLRHP
jgi:hypothetical protein